LLSVRTPAPASGERHFPGVYSLRPDRCMIEFRVKHMVLATARGSLSALEGSLVVDPDDRLASRVVVHLDATSLQTGSSERDEILRGPDFLDVEHFPTVSFESFDVVEIRPGRFRVWGDLYIKDLVGEIPLQTRLVVAGPDSLTFAATTALSRRAFGLTWDTPMEKFGVIVADTVNITLAAEFGA
jgi:polyisoprenoid-binding protein YceI